ncbi:hypothetical protein AAG906_030679 [Vitis piasezkii]
MEEAGNGMIKLIASNYSIWKTRMEDILYCKELFEPIECKGYKPVTTTEDEWKKLNRKTTGQIRQWVDQSVFHRVAKEVDAYSLWKPEPNRSQPRYKARLVVKGFIVLGLVASMNLEIEQLDVKTTFLHGDLEEEIYMEQPEVFTIKGKEYLVCQLKKSLYEFIIFDGEFIILLLYVEDMLIVGRDTESYIEKVLDKFNMGKAKPVSSPLGSHLKLSSKQSPSSEKEKEEMRNVPYASAVGSLMYAMVCTRPDIAHVVGVATVKWILRYLRGTSKTCLCFGTNKPVLVGCTNAYMVGDVDFRKFTSGYLITFLGGTVSWQSRLQKCVALSTKEVEYIAITEASKELLWMKKFLQELGLQQERSKHIDVRYHWIRDALEMKLFCLEKIHIDENGSDMMTKPIPIEKLQFCRKQASFIEPLT